MAFNTPFVPLEGPSTNSRLLQAKAVYFLMQLVIMAMGVYKVWIMGLLPTSGSDFLAWKAERPVPALSSLLSLCGGCENLMIDDGMECCLITRVVIYFYWYMSRVHSVCASKRTSKPTLCQSPPGPVTTERQ
jgi:hypothetical protein